MTLSLTLTDWLHLLLQFMGLSLLAVGGGPSVLPGMHHYLVTQQHWLSPEQFTVSVALAQVAPGPNILFAAMMGWHVGLNAGGFHSAAWGAVAALVAVVLPSSCLTLVATRWTRHHAAHPVVRAFKLGMAPVVVGLMLSSAVLLASPYSAEPGTDHLGLWLLGLATLTLLWRTRIHLVWVLLPAAALGALGWV